MSDIRVGLVGYGYAGRTFHAPLVAGVPGLSLTAVASSDPAKVRADWPDAAVEAGADALFARPDVDLVVIATPNDSHYPLARQALLAGKHVVVDKPFTLTHAQALELARLAEAGRRLLSVFHNRRWDGDFLTLAALIGDGRLGRVVQFESHFDRFRPQVRERWRESAAPGAGLWYDLGPHLLDQALQLFGEPAAIQLTLARVREGAQADDWFHAVLHPSGDGPHAVLHASALAARAGPRFLVHGTRGSYVKHGLDGQEDLLKNGWRPRWGETPSPPDPDGELHLAQVDAAVRIERMPTLPGSYLAYYAAVRAALREGGPPPVSPQEAARVMAWIEAGLHSARTGRACPAA